MSDTKGYDGVLKKNATETNLILGLIQVCNVKKYRDSLDKVTGEKRGKSKVNDINNLFHLVNTIW